MARAAAIRSISGVFGALRLRRRGAKMRAMPEPLDELAPEDLLARGDALLRELGQHGDLLPVAAFLALAQEKLREALAERREAGARAAAAYLACDAADRRLDDTIAALSLAALELGGTDTRDPLFARLFPEGPQAYTCAPVEEELRLVRELRDRLRGHPLEEAWDEPLAEGSREVEAAGRKLAAALDEEARAWARLRNAEIAWRLRARLARAALERYLAGRDRALLDTFDRLLPLPDGADRPR